MTRKYRKKEEKENILKRSIRFFYNTGYLPQYNLSNQYEMNLYKDRTDISYEDIDKDIVEKYKKVKNIHKKRLLIDKAIKEYYSYYLNNVPARFPTNSPNSTLEERRISRAYTWCKIQKNYLTYNQCQMIQMIETIKSNIQNRYNLKKVLDYVKFYEEYERTAIRKSRENQKINHYEDNIAVKMSRVNLEDLNFPKKLLGRLYTAVLYSDDKLSTEIKNSIF